MNEETNKVHVIPATSDNMLEMQEQTVNFRIGEGALYVKFVALSPQTLQENSDLEGLVARQPGFVYVGSFDEIKAAFDKSFAEMQAAYEERVALFNSPKNEEDEPSHRHQG